MNRPFISKRISAVGVDGRTLWLTADDRWSADPREAELIEDEAHGDIRLLDAELSRDRVRGIRIVDAAERV